MDGWVAAGHRWWSCGLAALDLCFHFLPRLALPCNSTQCELAALTLVAQFASKPALVLTDSLVSLQLIQPGVGHRSCPK